MKGKLRGGKKQHWNRHHQFSEKLTHPHACPPLPFLLQYKRIFPVTLICRCSPELQPDFPFLVRHCHWRALRIPAMCQQPGAQPGCSDCPCSGQRRMSPRLSPCTPGGCHPACQPACHPQHSWGMSPCLSTHTPGGCDPTCHPQHS